MPPQDFDWFGFSQDLNQLLVQGDCDVDTLANKFSETTPCETVILDDCFANYAGLIKVILDVESQGIDIITPSYTRMMECFVLYADEIHKQ